MLILLSYGATPFRTQLAHMKKFGPNMDIALIAVITIVLYNIRYSLVYATSSGCDND